MAVSSSPYVSSTLSTLKAVETVLPRGTCRYRLGSSYILGRGQTLRREREGETIDDKQMFVKMEVVAVRCKDTVFAASLVLRISSSAYSYRTLVVNTMWSKGLEESFDTNVNLQSAVGRHR